jgi:hypothetical protein
VTFVVDLTTAVFAVPHTEDVLTGLFDPRLPKSSLDFVTLFLLGSQILLWLWLPRSTSRVLFMVSFAGWRLAYKSVSSRFQAEDPIADNPNLVKQRRTRLHTHETEQAEMDCQLVQEERLP